MSKAQWILLLTLAASSYDVGTIWMVQIGYRLWPYVAPADFDTYHLNWWLKIIPVIFPVAGLALAGSLGLIWWRPEGVDAASVWTNVALQLVTGALTGAFWARWQAQTHFAKLADGSLDPMYARIMNTHWLRVALITAQGVVALWMMIEHLSARPALAK
jgi:hypothetical protein